MPHSRRNRRRGFREPSSDEDEDEHPPVCWTLSDRKSTVTKEWVTGHYSAECRAVLRWRFDGARACFDEMIELFIARMTPYLLLDEMDPRVLWDGTEDFDDSSVELFVIIRIEETAGEYRGLAGNFGRKAADVLLDDIILHDNARIKFTVRQELIVPNSNIAKGSMLSRIYGALNFVDPDCNTYGASRAKDNEVFNTAWAVLVNI